MEISTNSAKQYIHYDPDRIDFAASEDELNQIENAGANLWKDVCITSFGVGVPTLINAISSTSTTDFRWTLALFLNYLLGCVGLSFAVIFGIAWYRTRGELKKLILKIKGKPKQTIVVVTPTSIGEISPETGLSSEDDS
ncbi:MAG: hypothetical protein NUW37_18400 [Planctomycetes bacterium]|nr:hypothetical protein [Planctomycetota bacterium]